MSLSQYGKTTREADEPRSFPRRDALHAAILQAKADGLIIDAEPEPAVVLEPEPEPFVEMPVVIPERTAFRKTLMRKRRT